MPMYRKKPVVIEARQTGVDYDQDCSIMAWCGGYPLTAEAMDELPDVLFCITTPEGPHFVKSGDWVIKGVAGEFYPCKSEIFEATYEEYGVGYDYD